MWVILQDLLPDYVTVMGTTVVPRRALALLAFHSCYASTFPKLCRYYVNKLEVYIYRYRYIQKHVYFQWEFTDPKGFLVWRPNGADSR